METLENIGISSKSPTVFSSMACGCSPTRSIVLLGAVEQKRVSLLGAALNRGVSLPEPLASALPKSLDQWRAAGNVRRLWAGDSSLWTGADENKWLGWLDITRQQLAQVDQLVALAQEIKDAGFADAVLLGMGGSSLCPAVMRHL